MLIVVVVVSVVVVSVVVVIVRDLVSSDNNPFRRARLTNSTQSTQMKIESKVIYHYYDVSSLVNHDMDEPNNFILFDNTIMGLYLFLAGSTLHNMSEVIFFYKWGYKTLPGSTDYSAYLRWEAK